MPHVMFASFLATASIILYLISGYFIWRDEGYPMYKRIITLMLLSLILSLFSVYFMHNYTLANTYIIVKEFINFHQLFALLGIGVIVTALIIGIINIKLEILELTGFFRVISFIGIIFWTIGWFLGVVSNL